MAPYWLGVIKTAFSRTSLKKSSNDGLHFSGARGKMRSEFDEDFDNSWAANKQQANYSYEEELLEMSAFHISHGHVSCICLDQLIMVVYQQSPAIEHNNFSIG